MPIQIAHRIEYRYEKPVRPGRHTLRVTPARDEGLKVISHRVDIGPKPQLAYHARDANDNDALFVWFLGETDRISFEIATSVEPPTVDPENFILDPPALSLDSLYDAPTTDSLARYITPSDCAATKDLATSLTNGANGATLDFIAELRRYTSRRWKMTVREHGEPLAPAVTLTQDAAACRDVVAVFLDVCRHAGIAARFVSGYAVPEPDAETHHMHAWAELFLPGAGWRAFDPSSGVTVADRHVPTARAPDHVGAEPIVGTIAGNNVASKMSVAVNINT